MIKKILNFTMLLTFFLTFITNVNADTYNYDQFTAQLYDNVNGSLSERTTFKGDNYWSGQVGLTAYSSGAAWGFNSPTAIVQGHTYSLTVNFSTNNQSYSDIIFSSVNRIGLGTSLSSAKTSYQNATNTSLVYTNNANGILQFVFNANTTGSYLVVPFATSYSINSETVYFNNFIISDLGSSSDVSQDSINNSLNLQTNTITNIINGVEDSINNTINDNFQSCPDPVNLSYSTGKKFNTNGNLIDDASFSYTEDYYSFDSSHKITFKNVGISNVGYVILYDSSKQQIGYFGIRDRTINSPSAVYYRLSTNNLNLQVYLGTGECINKIDETNSQLNDLNNNITSEDSPDTSGLSDVAGWLPAGPVDSLINLPLSLFNSISRDLGSSCSPITLPLPYVNENLTLPCMSTFYEGIGIGDFMNWIGVIASGFMLFSYLMKLYKWVDDTLTFRENNHLDNWGGV